MKLSAKTLAVLKNFAAINQSIVVKPGNSLATISGNKTIMAKATVPDEFEQQFAIYNLGRFISSVSLMDSPDLEFEDHSVRIKGNGHSILDHFADPSVIISPPDKKIELPTVDVTCRLTSKNIQSVTKALGVLGLPEIAIAGDGEKVYLQAVDSKNPSADTFA